MYIPIDKNSSLSMTKQIYLFIKDKILCGELDGGMKLPSTRALSKELGISRNVALNSYNQLFAEGYLHSKERSGIFVVEGIRVSHESTQEPETKKNSKGLQFEENESLIDFRTGVPNLSLFPKEKWGKLYRQVCMDIDSQGLDYYEPCGSYELRYQLSKYLKRVRGVECNAKNIIITSGAAQSFSLLIQYFSKINKYVIAEDPMSSGITKILSFFDMNIHPVPVDVNGIITNRLPKNINPSLVFTTPSHQFPTGSVLPMNRRVALIDYAKKTAAYIVEDDYDSEFRYEGYPIQSMQSLAPENIIYVGTFSKTLCPALRTGYMILPRDLINKVKAIKYIDDLHSPVLEQLTLARFIEDGLMDRHVSLSRKYYSKKCAFLVNTLNNAFGDKVEIFGHTAGIHIMAKFKDATFSNELINTLRQKGLNINGVCEHTISSEKYNSYMLIGFGNLEYTQIEKGIQLLNHQLYT